MGNTRGFTLVEIAIVLVIIGLLIGGVLKGQEMIVQARIKNAVNDFNGISTAIYAYQDRYKRLPGDDPGANRWTVGGTALAGGNGNGLVQSETGYQSANDGDETRRAWLHLRLAGFVAGAADSVAAGSLQPANAAGGIVGVQQGALGLAGLVVCSGSLPTKMAQAIDAQFDDGNMLTGSIRGQIEAAPPTAVGTAALAEGTAGYVDNGSNLYVVCKTV